MRNYINEQNVKELNIKEGDILYYDMPPFCSGNYSSKVFSDENGKLFVTESYINVAVDYKTNKPYWVENQ